MARASMKIRAPPISWLKESTRSSPLRDCWPANPTGQSSFSMPRIVPVPHAALCSSVPTQLTQGLQLAQACIGGGIAVVHIQSINGCDRVHVQLAYLGARHPVTCRSAGGSARGRASASQNPSSDALPGHAAALSTLDQCRCIHCAAAGGADRFDLVGRISTSLDAREHVSMRMMLGQWWRRRGRY